ncbi:MAG: S-layer homology domain-containing protein, partial [Thermoleophilia bacterium]|nr:S-layer homology domain-containing protein [Thermoleophilia bacterium]
MSSSLTRKLKAIAESRERVVLVCVLVGVLAVGLGEGLFSAPWSLAESAGNRFPDVSADHPYVAAIEDLVDRGIVSGYPDGMFGPDKLVTRQQFAKMVVSTLGWPVSEGDGCPFLDVATGGPETLYPDNFIAVAAARGVILGTSKGRFSPLGFLGRAQMVTMIVRAVDSLAAGPLPDAKNGGAGTWRDLDSQHAANALWAEREGLLEGLPLRDLDPYGSATRGEVAQVLHNLIRDVRYFGAKGDGVTDDAAAFQAALSAAPAGSTVVVPPATYRIGSTVDLKSGVTLSGPGATLYMPGQSSTTALLDVDGTTGVQIVGLRLRSDPVTTMGRSGSYVIGICGVSEGASDLTVRDLATENLKYGMKLGSSGASYRLTVQNWVGRGDTQSLFLGSVKGGTLTNLDFDCRTSSDLDHNIYLESGNTDLVFDTVRLAGGTGYSLHLYMDSTATADRGQRITFRHVRLDSPNQGVVVERYDGVTFEDLTGSTIASDAFFVIYTMTNLSVDGFDVAGTPYAFLADNGNGSISGVTIRNGVYRQPRLLGGENLVSGLLLENTSSSTSSQTTTTLRPATTTTTLQPTTTTTTTTLQPTTTTTTTTLRPTTTTS